MFVRTRSAVIVSVLAHAGALIAVARGSSDRAAAEAVVVTVGPVAPAPAPDEVIVELYVEPAAALAPGAAAGPVRASDRRGAPAAATAAGARVTTGTGGTGARGELQGPAAEPAPGGALAMRGRRHDLALSDEALGRVTGGGPAAVEAPVASSSKLVQRGREHVIDDETVAIRIRPDGTVALRDKADFDIHIGLPSLSQLRKLFGGRAREAFEEGPMFVPLIWGRADVTAALMRQTGAGDPYAARKRRLLDDTRAERVEIGARYRADLRARSAELVQRNLEALWREVTDPAERRAALFALWDECTEDDAGARARAMVIGWIGRHAPAGSAGAYSDAEVARLDASRTSRAHFVPYPPRD